jgi:hypothetical protein
MLNVLLARAVCRGQAEEVAHSLWQRRRAMQPTAGHDKITLTFSVLASIPLIGILCADLTKTLTGVLLFDLICGTGFETIAARPRTKCTTGMAGLWDIKMVNAVFAGAKGGLIPERRWPSDLGFGAEDVPRHCVRIDESI